MSTVFIIMAALLSLLALFAVSRENPRQVAVAICAYLVLTVLKIAVIAFVALAVYLLVSNI